MPPLLQTPTAGDNGEIWQYDHSQAKFVLVVPAVGDPTMGGDLTGLASNAQIAAGAVGGTEIAAAIKDAAAGTDSLRTLGTGATQAAAGNHAHAASAVSFSATGSISATNVQSAIAEVASEAVAAGMDTGGTTGQIWRKSSATDYDAGWSDHTHASSHAPGGADRVYLDAGRRLATSYSPLLPEMAVNDYAVASERLLLVYGRPATSFTASQMACVTGATASASITLSRMGIYTVASDLAITLVASTANDTALTGTASAVRTKALSVNYDMVAGTLYALAILQVATTPGSLRTARTNTAMADATGTFWPVLGRSLASQTDLPSSAASGASWEASSQVAGAVFLAAAA